MILFVSLTFTAITPAQESLPPQLEQRIATGVEALKSGDLDTAEKIFDAALRQGVKHPLVFHNLGVIAQQRRDHKLATTRFRQAIQLQPSYGPSHLLLGASLRALGKNTEAVHELERATKLMPKEPQAYLQLAKAYEASDNWIAAVVEFQKLVELSPQEPEYRYQLGRAWTKLSGWSYQEIKHLNPDSARLQQALGQEYAIQEKYDFALAAYQRAAKKDPGLPEIHLATAVILLELKRFDEALTEIDLEQKLVPESKAASETRARIEAAKGSSTP
jgi:Flp pilus assembly protein TadD